MGRVQKGGNEFECQALKARAGGTGIGVHKKMRKTARALRGRGLSWLRGEGIIPPGRKPFQQAGYQWPLPPAGTSACRNPMCRIPCENQPGAFASFRVKSYSRSTRQIRRVYWAYQVERPISRAAL